MAGWVAVPVEVDDTAHTVPTPLETEHWEDPAEADSQDAAGPGGLDVTK